MHATNGSSSFSGIHNTLIGHAYMCVVIKSANTYLISFCILVHAAKNIWKKRFFEEKRKTAALEEQVNRLRHEVDAQHKALMSYLENKGTLICIVALRRLPAITVQQSQYQVGPPKSIRHKRALWISIFCVFRTRG